MQRILAIAKKELIQTFSSPMAYLFLAAFLGATLFVFFWVETFFARNIADIRPLFDWLPVLLVFLVASLTMRLWSEERRSGTLEFLLTSPVPVSHLVLGKFLATFFLVALSLLLTLCIPLTVSFLGNLDWGVVIGAYLAALLLSATYIATGLFVSSKSENQMVSLIITTLLCGFFYLLGSNFFASFFGNNGVEILKLLGTGSRFESIARGVLDLRDIYYYISLTGIFLILNTTSLEKMRWPQNSKKYSSQKIRVWLIVFNLIAANLWLAPVRIFRADLTEDKMYSISTATKNILSTLEEPLTIKAIFSSKTHPLLAPLIPQMKDMLREYALINPSKTRLEIINPQEDEEVEAEISRKYGIKPMTFHIPNRYEQQLISSYFNIVIEYGDEYEVLDFRKLTEIRQSSETEIEVKLKNFEYDMTRSIKKVLFGFKNVDSLFASLKKPIQFVGYFSEDSSLPASLKSMKQNLETTLQEYKQKSGGKFSYKFLNPMENPELAREIENEYGFKPMVTSLVKKDTFYFYMTLQNENQVIMVQIPDEPEEEGKASDEGITEALKTNIDAGLKRFAPGFLKTVGIVTPFPELPENPYMQPSSSNYELLQAQLEENYTLNLLDLSTGKVDDNTDVLLVLAPKNLDEKSLFAIDQFLMKGGTVILLTSPYFISQTQKGIDAQTGETGLEDWLLYHGITVENSLVLDPINSKFPVAVTRNVGDTPIQEIHMVNYPYSINLRPKSEKTNFVAGIPELIFFWSSPIAIDSEANKDRKVEVVLKSSDQSWASEQTDLVPSFTQYPDFGFKKDGKEQSYPVGVVVEGKFDSFFKDASPLFDKKNNENEKAKSVIGTMIEKSPSSSRLIVYSSNEFVSDQTMELSQAGGMTSALFNLQLIENTVDWSLEDRSLVSIRSRSQFAKTLISLKKGESQTWEVINYIFVVSSLIGVYFLHAMERKRRKNRFIEMKYIEKT